MRNKYTIKDKITIAITILLFAFLAFIILTAPYKRSSEESPSPYRSRYLHGILIEALEVKV